MKKFSLTDTIGDCLVAGAAVQQLATDINERIGFHTAPVLKPFFVNHPKIEFLENDNDCKRIRWVSQVDHKLFRLNSVNRYANQIGAICDSSCVLDIYDENKNKVLWEKKENTVVINCSSAETSRRFIPQNVIDFILEQKIADNIVYVGNSHGQETCKDIPTIARMIRDCRFLIGPVSFPYHLAQCYRTPILSFFSYVTDYKFSSYYRIFSVNPDVVDTCATECEEKEQEIRSRENCWSGCKLPNMYNKKDILRQLERIMEYTK